MNTKFTRGEWSVDGDQVYIINGWMIADCDFGNLERQYECNANAHLIAAAPDMYAMIESLSFELQCAIDSINNDRMSKVTQQTETPPDLWDQESLHNAQLLLKKARGE